MICPKCNTQNLEGSQFCSNCGALLSAVVSPVSPQPVMPQAPSIPQAQVAVAGPVNISMEYVGFLPRLLSYLIDLILITLIVSLVNSTIQLVLFQSANTLEMQSIITSYIISILSTFVIVYPYFIICAVKFGGTVGKLMMGQMIVNENGEKIDWRQALLRYVVGYMVNSFTLGIGYIWVIFDSRKQGLHDKIANTFVIKRPEGKSRTAGIGCLVVGIVVFIMFMIVTFISVMNKKPSTDTFQNQIPQFDLNQY